MSEDRNDERQPDERGVEQPDKTPQARTDHEQQDAEGQEEPGYTPQQRAERAD